MIKYHLDKEAYNYLCEWAEENKTAVKYCPAYDKKSEICLAEYPKEVKFLVESKNYGVKFQLLDDEGLAIKGKMTHHSDSNSDFDLIFDLRDNIKNSSVADEYIRAMQVYCTSYLHANCFMWYGNIAESKQYVASGKNESEHLKIISFRKFKDTVYAVPVGHHRSPEGVFSVRGHFRRYQSGKVIWIDEFLKGTK